MHICIVKTHLVWLQKLCLTIKLTFWNNTFIIHNIITLVTPVILNISWFFLFIYLFSCIFININVASGHWINKEKYFGCLHYHRYIHNDWYDSPYPIFACCIECLTILKFVRIAGLIHFHQPLCHFNIYSPLSTSSALNRY